MMAEASISVCTVKQGHCDLKVSVVLLSGREEVLLREGAVAKHQ